MCYYFFKCTIIIALHNQKHQYVNETKRKPISQRLSNSIMMLWNGNIK